MRFLALQEKDMRTILEHRELLAAHLERHVEHRF